MHQAILSAAETRWTTSLWTYWWDPARLFFCDTDMDISIQDLKRLKLPPDTDRLFVRTRPSAGYLSREAAAHLVEAEVRLVGVDSSSVDAPESPDLPVHQTLLKAETVIIENLALDSIELGNYWLVCLPLWLHGSDGAPARAILMDSAPQTTPINHQWKGQP